MSDKTQTVKLVPIKDLVINSVNHPEGETIIEITAPGHMSLPKIKNVIIGQHMAVKSDYEASKKAAEDKTKSDNK